MGNLFWFFTGEERASTSYKAPIDTSESPSSSEVNHSRVMPARAKARVTDPPQTPLIGQPLEVRRLEQLFDLDQFAQLAAQWERFSEHYPQRAMKLKTYWLAEIKRGLQGEEINRSLYFLDAWLTHFPNDFDSQWLQSTYHFVQTSEINDLETMFHLAGSRAGVKNDIYTHQMNTIIEAQLVNLKNKHDWPLVIKLLEYVLWHQPSNNSYIFGLANAYFHIEQFEQSRLRLASLTSDIYYGKQARELLSQINQITLTKAAFPLVKQSAHYLINGQLSNNGLTLLIDTGASISVLAKWFFDQAEGQLNANFVGNGTIDTAGGRVEAPIYRFDYFAIGEYRVSDIEFVIMELSQGDRNSQGLLGMNFLKHFKFNLDQDNEYLVLEPRY